MLFWLSLSCNKKNAKSVCYGTLCQHTLSWSRFTATTNQFNTLHNNTSYCQMLLPTWHLSSRKMCSGWPRDIFSRICFLRWCSSDANNCHVSISARRAFKWLVGSWSIQQKLMLNWAVHPAQCCAYHVAHNINTCLKTLQKLGILLDCLREEDCSSMVRRKEEREEATRRRACAACTSRHCVSVVWKLCASTSRLLHCNLCKQLHSAMDSCCQGFWNRQKFAQWGKY